MPKLSGELEGVLVTELEAARLALSWCHDHDGYSVTLRGSIDRDTFMVSIDEPGKWSTCARVYGDSTPEELLAALQQRLTWW